MSCTEAHSRTEWYSCPPVKRLGVGSPIELSSEPSVPPRMGVRSGSIPSSRIACSAASTISGNGSRWLRMFGYCWRTSISRRARLGGDDLLGGRAQQRDVPREQVVVEVAHDRADDRLAGGGGDVVDVDEAAAPLGG